MKKRIILYNPAAPYYTMPLQFLALAAVMDSDRYEVVIIDARVERSTGEAHEKMKRLLPGALCVGVSVITGTPIRDARAMTGMVKKSAPGVPVVWGGWHPSIFPEQCLREGGADYCVRGQGELTFLELLEALEAGRTPDDIAGVSFLRNGSYAEAPDRKFADINRFPPYDYGLLPVETYFGLKGRRQLDFYSSQGCPYRCAFCADPYVYNRRWSGLKGTRMLTDVFAAVRTYQVDDVNFQDENFFANRNRVIEFCRGARESGLTFTWSATSRADQIAPLDDSILEEARHAGLRRVVIGAESGSQTTLDFMKKDTLAEETLISASNLARNRIGATFNFIVGFPGDSFDETRKTLETIKEIKRIDMEFEFGVFFFTPYPGTELFRWIVDRGYRVPSTLAEWSDIDFIAYSGYWVRPAEKNYVNRFKFYTRLASERRYALPILAPLRAIAGARLRSDFYGLALEKGAYEFIRHRVMGRPQW